MYTIAGTKGQGGLGKAWNDEPPLLEIATPTSSNVDDEDDDDDDGDDRHSKATLEGMGMQEMISGSPGSFWEMNLSVTSHENTSLMAVGLDHADIWARTMEFLPFHDVRSVAAVSRFFLHDVMNRITVLYIYSHKDLHAAQSRRFARGVVRSVYILSLYRKKRFCLNLDERPPRYAVYCRETAAKTAQFLSGFNHKTLKEMFFGAHLIGIRHQRKIYPHMTWDGRSQWQRNNIEYGTLEKRFRTFRFGRTNLYFPARALYHHRMLVMSVLSAIHAGAIPRSVSSVGLVQGWVCPTSNRTGKCECWDLLKVLPIAWIRSPDSPWRKRICLTEAEVEFAIQKRIFQRFVLPHMTRQCVDGVPAVVLDSLFIELVRVAKNRFLGDAIFPRFVVSQFMKSLRRSPKVHSKLCVGDFVELQLLGWHLNFHDFVIILRDTEIDTAVDIERHCVAIERDLNQKPTSVHILEDEYEPFSECNKRVTDLEGYYHLRLAWVPSRPPTPRRRLRGVWRRTFGRRENPSIKLERLPSKATGFGNMNSDLFSVVSSVPSM